jgi:hypothetical protein
VKKGSAQDQRLEPIIIVKRLENEHQEVEDFYKRKKPTAFEKQISRIRKDDQNTYSIPNMQNHKQPDTIPNVAPSPPKTSRDTENRKSPRARNNLQVYN